MVMRALSPQAREEGERRFLERFEEAPLPQYKNAVVASVLDSPVQLRFRGRVFDVDPISVEDGFLIADIISEWDTNVSGKSGPEATALGRSLYDRGLALARKLLYPAGPRWMRWLYRDPFKNVTEGEFILLMRFLSLSRMR